MTALALAGMPVFEALCHAMTTVSTAGFSTHDASIGHYRSAVIEWILIVFMLLGGMTFVLLVRVARGNFAPLRRDQQTTWYFAYVAAFVVLLALWQIVVNGRDAGSALQSSAFNVVSIATTTGFTTEDYTLWGSLPLGAMIVIFFIGGCTGSTAGGIKVFRFCVLGGVARWQVRHLVHPHRMTPPTYNGQPISDEIVRSVLSFFVFHMACFALLSMALSAFGLDFVTSVSGAAQALNNIGPGLGPVIGPAGTYAALPDGAKWLLAVGQLLGRLELLTVLVLLSPTFWRG
jgi:trk system potassium uptake protein TrkH